jgi:hypothetical protein
MDGVGSQESLIYIRYLNGLFHSQVLLQKGIVQIQVEIYDSFYAIEWFIFILA